MPELVMVSSVERKEKLKPYLEELFKKERWSEITQAIGMHSILIDPEHMMADQAELYRFVLNMLKSRISKAKGKTYGAWYGDFSKILDQIVAAKQVVSDAIAADVLASHRAAFGPFKSVDDFFFWALDDRRLPLQQIVQYIEKTTTNP